jgi:triosephosphate isomerase
MQRRTLVVGNWKMNGLKADGLALAANIVERAKAETPHSDIAVCPPATLIDAVAGLLAGTIIAVGAQDCHADAKGAHTGDLAAAMIKDLGARYVILGHSERRKDHAETDAQVRAKAEAAHAAGLIAIICVGETEAERKAGRTLEVVKTQFENSLPAAATPANTVIAYEPVWAIGTGVTATTEQVAEVHADVRRLAAAKLGADAASQLLILYGGSVNPKNSGELLALVDVDGGLVGGCSLKPDEFWAIIQSGKQA